MMKVEVRRSKGLTERLILGLAAVLALWRPAGCQDSVTLLPGNVTLGAIFAVQNLQNEGCGNYDVDSLKEVVAVTWFLRAVNEMDYVPGVTIGLEAYRTCQSAELAARAAVRMLEKYKVLDGTSQSDAVGSPLLGVLGPDTTETAIAVSKTLGSMPRDQRLLQISGTATGEALSDKTLYPNFFRVIPPDSTQVKVLAELLVQIKWNYVAIVYDDDAYGRQAATQLKALAQDRDICVPVFAALPLDIKDTSFTEKVNSIRDDIDGGGTSVIKGVVFIGSVTSANKFVDLLDEQLNFARFVFSEGIGLQSSPLVDSSNQPFVLTKGAFAASPPYLPFPEVRNFWATIWENRTVFLSEARQNQWLANLYKQETNCQSFDNYQCWQNNLDTAASLGSTSQWLFEYYQVKAVAIFAHALKLLHSDKCGGARGLCDSLKNALRNNRRQIQDTLESMNVRLEAQFPSITAAFEGQRSVRFDDRGEVVNSGQSDSLYDVYNFRRCQGNTFCFQQVGSMSPSGQLTLNTSQIEAYENNGDPLTWPQFPKSQCEESYDCVECLPDNVPGQVVFVPGDFYVVAVAAVHDREGDSTLRCGDIRVLSGADLVQSVLFAVAQVNAKNRQPFTGIFGNKKLGVIILDSCYRELVIKERLIDLHKGTLMLPDGNTSSTILPYIAGYVGGYFSTISVAMYEVISELEKRFVIVGPSNTSPVLSDRDKYAYYLRLTTSHTKLVTAMLTLVRDLQSHYVQVIYDPSDVYSSSLKSGLDEMSAQFNVCISQSIPTRYKDANMYPVLDNMRKTSSASIVIVTIQVLHVRKLMGQILTQMSSSDRFVFLGSEAWARREEVLSVAGKNKLLGSLTFSQELPLDQLFDDYFRQVNALTTPNPWLKYFWEEKLRCYFDGSFLRKDKPQPCPRDLTSDYKQDPWTPFYIQTIYAFALGLNAAMKAHCGTQASYLCDGLTSENLVDALKTVKLDLYNTGQPVKVFDDNGDGDIKFKVFQVTRGDSADTMIYDEVGRFEHGTLTLNKNDELWLLKNNIKAECPNPDTCNKCFPPQQQGPNSTIIADDSNDGSRTGFIAGIVILVIIIIALVVLLVILWRRQRLPSPAVDEQKLSAQNWNNGSEEFNSGLSEGGSVNRSYRDMNSVPSSQALGASGGMMRQNSSMSGVRDFGNARPTSGSHYDYLQEHRDSIMSRDLPPPPISESASSLWSDRSGGLPRQESGNTSGSAGYAPRNSAGQFPVSSNPNYTPGESSGRYAPGGESGGGGNAPRGEPSGGYVPRVESGGGFVPRAGYGSGSVPRDESGGQASAGSVGSAGLVPRGESSSRASVSSYVQPDNASYDALNHYRHRVHDADAGPRQSATYTPLAEGGSAGSVGSGGSGVEVVHYENRRVKRPTKAVASEGSSSGPVSPIAFENDRNVRPLSIESSDSLPPAPPPPLPPLPHSSHDPDYLTPVDLSDSDYLSAQQVTDI